MNGRVSQAVGNRHHSYAPHGNYPCQGEDQWIGIAATTDTQWQALCRTLGCIELLADPRFSDSLSRWQNQEALDGILASATREQDGMELMERLQLAGVAAGPALPMEQFWANPHLRERGFFQSYQDQDGARTERELPTVPWRFNGQREGSFTGQPHRGQHNSYVFDELLGLAEEEVEILLEEQVIY